MRIRAIPGDALAALLLACLASIAVLSGLAVLTSPADAAAPAYAAARAGASGQTALAVIGVARRPFPLLMPLDYAWARGAAWLDALNQGAERLPGIRHLGLAALGLEGRAGELALAAGVFALESLTPENADGILVEALLVAPPAAGQGADAGRNGRPAAGPAAGPDDTPHAGSAVAAALAATLRAPELVAVRRALIADLAQALARVRDTWPASLAEARARAPELEAARARLDALWLALDAAGPHAGGWLAGPENLGPLEQAASGAPDNAAVLLLLAEARLRRGLPQGALAAADEALRLSLAKSDAGDASDLGLAGRARYVRALAHWRLDQAALAEADLDAALAAAPASQAAQGEERARRLRARGAIRLQRRERAGMCADFAAACALGDCEGLAEARRRGHCLNAPDTADVAAGPETTRDAAP